MASRMLLRNVQPRILHSRPLILSRLSSTSPAAATAAASTSPATPSTTTATAAATTATATETTATAAAPTATAAAVTTTTASSSSAETAVEKKDDKKVEDGYAHGAYVWSMERASSVALVPLITTQFVYGAHPIADGLLGVVLPYHIYLGFESCIIDYIPKREFPRMHKAANWTLLSTTALVMWGAYEFNVNEIGITEFLKRCWQS